MCVHLKGTATVDNPMYTKRVSLKAGYMSAEAVGQG